MRVRKAVIPAAGLGTRFLPATKSIPKEMIPVVDRPGIQYAVEECVRAGIVDILFVTSHGKSALEDHFDSSPELEDHLEAKKKLGELEIVRSLSQMAHIHAVRQNRPLGFGHAVLQAREHVGNEPFVVMVPDEIVPEPLGDEPALLERMIEIHEAHDALVVAVKEVPPEDVSSYGIVDPVEQKADSARIKHFVEKPSVDEAPSNLASVGRYILTPAVFDALEETEPGVGGEIQLTDGIMRVIESDTGYAYIHHGPIYDVGRVAEFLKATVELALRRNDLAKPFKEVLASLDLRPE
jgi:UTP--glucose-1-phosphate uridylyltransferase